MKQKKKKKIFDKEKHDNKKRHGRMPMSKPTEWHKDKKRYSRKKKYKEDYENDND